MGEATQDGPLSTATGELGRWLTVLLNSMPDYAWTKDLDGRFLALNKAGARLCGHSDPHQPIGKTDHDFFPAELADDYRACDRRVQESGRQEAVVERLIRPDGATIWLETTKSPLLDPSGRLLGTVGIARDINSRKAAESRADEPRRLEMLGRLAGGIAHNFNNLFGTILGYSGFALEDLAPDHPAADYARKITAVGHKGKAVIEQILAFSEMGAPLRRRFPLSVLMAEIERYLAVAAPRRHRIVLKAAPEALVIDGDERQILQAILKLCLNGKEALEGRSGILTVGLEPTLPAGPILRRLQRPNGAPSADIEMGTEANGTIWLATGSFDPAQDHVSLTIEDTARGMDYDVMRQLFTPFFTTNPAEHLGLGLAITRESIVAHGGALIIRSRPGKGTKTEVILPLVSR